MEAAFLTDAASVQDLAGFHQEKFVCKVINPKMHNMGQIDPNNASHVDCLKHFANFVSAFLDFVSNLLHSHMS